jgi:hypothetical protein
MTKQELPETLIKYYECNKYNCEAVINSYIWASHPKQFNDPFDCPMEVWDKNSFSDDIFKKIIHPDFYKNFGHILMRNPRDEYIKFMNLFTGIICLNKYVEKNEDLLWGYYNQQKGFSVEFSSYELSNNFNSVPEEVQYREPNQFRIFQIPKNIQDASALFPLLTDWIKQKKRIWENESEWRYIFFDCNYDPCSGYGMIETRKKEFSLDSIKRITLGFKFFDGCYLEKTEKGFKYDISKDGNIKEKKKLLRFIKKNQVRLDWINLFNLKLVRVTIEIEMINCKTISFKYS